MLVVEDEPYMAEAIRDGLRLEAITADIASDGGTATLVPALRASRRSTVSALADAARTPR